MKAAVSQPCCWRRLARVGVDGDRTKPPVSRTLWVGGLSPVKMLACEGGVKGVCVTPFSNRTPLWAMRSSVGVSMAASPERWQAAHAASAHKHHHNAFGEPWKEGRMDSGYIATKKRNGSRIGTH